MSLNPAGNNSFTAATVDLKMAAPFPALRTVISSSNRTVSMPLTISKCMGILRGHRGILSVSNSTLRKGVRVNV